MNSVNRRSLLIASAAIAAPSFIRLSKAASGNGGDQSVLLGAYGGFNPSLRILPAFERWLGRPMECLVDNFNYDDRANFNSGFAAQIPNYTDFSGRVVWGIPLICNGETLEQANSGFFDTSWLSCIRAIYSARSGIEPTFHIRPNWEFNFFDRSLNPWNCVGKEAIHNQVWIRFWNLCQNYKPGLFKFTWCPNWAQSNPEPAYPGDQYVDIIGMDAYYDIRYEKPDGRRAWANKLSAPYGYNWLTAFAHKHNKPIAVPEWGINSDAGGASYIPLQAAWFRATQTVYQGYWESNSAFSGLLQDNQYPLAGAAFIKAFAT